MAIFTFLHPVDIWGDNHPQKESQTNRGKYGKRKSPFRMHKLHQWESQKKRERECNQLGKIDDIFFIEM